MSTSFLGPRRYGGSCEDPISLLSPATKRVIRYAVVLLTAFIAGGRLIGAYQAGSDWRTWAVRDPSAAEAYRTYFVGDLVSALLSLAIAGLVWWLLRDQPGNQTDR